MFPDLIRALLKLTLKIINDVSVKNRVNRQKNHIIK